MTPRTARCPGVGLLQCHGPGRAAGLAAHGPQLAIQRHQRMQHAVPLQHGGHAVHRVALGNAAQVQLHRRVLAGAACGPVQFQVPCSVCTGMGWRAARMAAASGASRAAPNPRHPPERPRLDQTRRRSGAGLPARRPAPPAAQRAGSPRCRRARGSGAPGRWWASRGTFARPPAAPLRPGLGAGPSQVQGGVGIQADRPARAHGRAVQGGALAGCSGFRTRLRHNAPWL
jgi:hypothetical protein